jgi:hypothetical protein
MIRSLAWAASLFGSIAAATLACSDTDAPSSPADVPALKQSSAPTLTPQQSGTTNRLQAISRSTGASPGPAASAARSP